jgi:hypothetical protein
MWLAPLLFLSCAFAFPKAPPTKPPGIILVGDSTTKWDGGWGIPGFSGLLNNSTLKLFFDYGVSGVCLVFFNLLESES